MQTRTHTHTYTHTAHTHTQLRALELHYFYSLLDVGSVALDAADALARSDHRCVFFRTHANNTLLYGLLRCVYCHKLPYPCKQHLLQSFSVVFSATC
jgi:hypothetical protein